ncbi:MAG: hypothetical protein H0X29_09210 [Parachlamydiaceae bacterium]|nr:hypothetical protein [Parachlamydiaceae bacterium]
MQTLSHVQESDPLTIQAQASLPHQQSAFDEKGREYRVHKKISSEIEIPFFDKSNNSHRGIVQKFRNLLKREAAIANKIFELNFALIEPEDKLQLPRRKAFIAPRKEAVESLIKCGFDPQKILEVIDAKVVVLLEEESLNSYNHPLFVHMQNNLKEIISARCCKQTGS